MSVIIITPLGIPSTSLLFSHATYLLRVPKPCVSTCQHLHLPSLPVPILLLMNYPKSVFYLCSRSHLFIPTQRDYPTNSLFIPYVISSFAPSYHHFSPRLMGLGHFLFLLLFTRPRCFLTLALLSPMMIMGECVPECVCVCVCASHTEENCDAVIF